MQNSTRFHVICLTAIGIISLFLYCGLYTVPSADDYFYANIMQEYGSWKTQVVHYVEWSGRYVATFLITLFSLTGYEYYWAVPFFCILSLLLSLYLFLRVFFKKTLEEKTVRMLSLAFIALFLSATTAGYGHGILVINEGFFWLSGAITYVGSLSLLLVFLSCLTFLYRRQYVFLNYILCLLLLFIIAGLNETAMFLLCIGIFPLLVFLRKKLGLTTLITFTIIIGISSALVVFAPGNEVRAGTSDGGNILKALGICVEKVVQIFFYYLLNPIIWLFVLALHTELTETINGLTKIISKKFFFLLGGILVYALYFPVAYSLNSGAPDRLIAFIGFFALIMSIFYANAMLPWLISKFKTQRNLVIVTITASVIGSYYCAEPLRIAFVTAFSGPQFFSLHEDRKQQFRQAEKNGEKDIVVDFIERNPLLLFEDLLPGNNEQVAKFYGLESIQVQPHNVSGNTQ